MNALAAMMVPIIGLTANGLLALGSVAIADAVLRQPRGLPRGLAAALIFCSRIRQVGVPRHWKLLMPSVHGCQTNIIADQECTCGVRGLACARRQAAALAIVIGIDSDPGCDRECENMQKRT